jgi:NADH:ubiquinone oxidoreductase subunit 3 (subunit A)
VEGTLLQDWLYVAIFLAFAMLIPGIAISLAGLLAPKKPTFIKMTVYECGMETIGSSRIRFKPQYYLFAIIFLIFDIETVLLYPFAVAYQRVGLYAVLEVVLFILILAAGLGYAWRRGALEWHVTD